jgi:cold shock CspA family protein
MARLNFGPRFAGIGFGFIRRKRARPQCQAMVLVSKQQVGETSRQCRNHSSRRFQGRSVCQVHVRMIRVGGAMHWAGPKATGVGRPRSGAREQRRRGSKARSVVEAPSVGRNTGTGTTGSVMSGAVERVIRERGFGFIKAQDGQRYFFHQACTNEFGQLTPGRPVTFVPLTTSKGLSAKSIRIARATPGSGT